MWIKLWPGPSVATAGGIDPEPRTSAGSYPEHRVTMQEHESTVGRAGRPAWMTWKLGCALLMVPPVLLLILFVGLVLFGDNYPVDREWFPAALHDMGDHGR